MMADLLTPEEVQGAITRSKTLLRQFGFPEFGELDRLDTQQMAQTLGCIDSLIASRQREVAQRAELFERIQQSEREKTTLMYEVERAKDEVERLQSELSRVDNTSRVNQSRWNEERKVLTEERNRLLIDLKKLASKEVQTQHELGRVNQQNVKLQESLRRTLGEKDLAVKNPLELTSKLQGSLGQLASAAGFEEFSNIVMIGYAKLRGVKEEIERLDSELTELMNAAQAILDTKQIRTSRPTVAAQHLMKLAEQLALTNTVNVAELQDNLQRWKDLAVMQKRLLIALNPETEVVEAEDTLSKYV
jgi:hypothetical protein